MKLENRERWALVAMGLIGLITAGWWALALWPTPGNSPDWLVRAKNICFGSTETGLPNVGGWLLLVGQPAGMLGVLVVVWWSEVQGGLRKVAASSRGRWGLATVGLFTAAGLTAAGVRVAEARELARWSPDDLAVPVTYPHLDREAPAFALTDQAGNLVSLETFAGRIVLVTFGFGHCETVCPLVIHNARLVQERVGEELGAESRPVVLVITLDPWRDTPSILRRLVDQWELGEDGFVLGGSVDDVNDALDAWNVARMRDLTTGDITHPALTFIVDRDGRLAYATTGDRNAILKLLERL